MLRSVVRRKISVTAVSAEDVERVLRRLGLYDDTVNGRAKCFICGKVVSMDTIGGMLMVGGRVVLVCDRPACIAKAALLAKEQKQE